MKVWLRQVRLNRQGYTDRGVYYGVGQPLYIAQWEDPDSRWGEEVLYFRAANRAEAREKVMEQVKGATFYR